MLKTLTQEEPLLQVLDKIKEDKKDDKGTELSHEVQVVLGLVGY